MGKKLDAFTELIRMLTDAVHEDRAVLVIIDDPEMVRIQTTGDMQTTLPLLYIAHRLYRDITHVPEGPIQ